MPAVHVLIWFWSLVDKNVLSYQCLGNRVTIVIKLLMTVGTNLHVMSINLAQMVNILSEDLGFKNGS